MCAPARSPHPHQLLQHQTCLLYQPWPALPHHWVGVMSTPLISSKSLFMTMSISYISSSSSKHRCSRFCVIISFVWFELCCFSLVAGEGFRLCLRGCVVCFLRSQSSMLYHTLCVPLPFKPYPWLLG